MDTFIQQLINGLVLGSVYALIALGYTMVYGIINLINFAHGEVLMVGALTSWAIIVTMQEAMPGAPPALTEPPSACSFAPRCKHAQDRGRAALPPVVQLGEGRVVRCILAEQALTAAA